MKLNEMRKILLTTWAVIVMSILPIQTADAVEYKDFSDITQTVGFVTGSTHGVGLAYGRHNNESNLGWQISGFPVWTEDERHVYFGAAIFKTLHQGKKGRAFMSFGACGFYNRSVYSSDDVWVKEETDKSVHFLFGPGIGLERHWATNFAFYFEMPMAIHIESGQSFALVPLPNMGLLYRWDD